MPDGWIVTISFRTLYRTCQVDFSNVFNVFSKRHRLNENSTSLTPQFRNRVFLLWRRTFPRGSPGQFLPDRSRLWSETYDRLLYSIGQPRLSKSQVYTADDDLDNFLGECSDEHFLDFVEFSFQSEAVWEHGEAVGELIVAINSFFQEDSLPFVLTDFSFSEVEPASAEADIAPSNQSGRLDLQTYPQIVRRDSEVVHQTAIGPTLTLLKNPALREANNEFLKALADYRKGDYEDCVAKCGSSLESVMKVICSRRGWPSQNDAGKLLSATIRRTSLPPFLKQPLIQIATIRNELGSSHGAGTQSRNVPKHVAQYTINVTASAILLLVEEAGQ